MKGDKVSKVILVLEILVIIFLHLNKKQIIDFKRTGPGNVPAATVSVVNVAASVILK